MEEKKSYFAIIPTLILFDDELLHKPKTILLYGHISTLANKTGECWATNKYFAEVLQTSTRTVSDYISLLKNKGYIKIKTTYRKGTKQIEKRLLFPTNPIEAHFHSIETGCDTPIETGCDTPIEAHFQDNNTSINNTSINNKRNIKESQPSLTDRFSELWKLYPKKQGKQVAFRAYKRAVKKGTTDDEIKQGIVNYEKYIKVKHIDNQFIKQGSTWFNQGCWEDDYSVSNKQDEVMSNVNWKVDW